MVVAEAGKGYDVLFLGLDKPMNRVRPGTSSSEVESIFRGFENPIALTVARGKLLENPGASLVRILVPVTGTDYSRLAAEVAIAIARASKCAVSALNIYKSPTSFDLLGARSKDQFKTGRAVVRDIEALGEREGVTVQPLAVAGRDDGSAMLRQIKRGNYDLVVIGIKTRPVEGEGLFFGQSAAILLDRSPCSLLVVRS
ncbi:MAG TPA: universal stress protein, partial [Blastocatellia bacterium]|nr:universal stress protein [Blastocatellia bacterium]